MTAPYPVPAADEFATPAQRLVAWVDGAGAFLICLDDSVALGGLSGRADVRLTADLSARHASIQRSGEGYFVVANAPALVANETASHSGRRGSGRAVEGRTDLNHADELVLYREGGGAVRLRFHKPNALTSTAVLSVASEHRTEPRYDGIVLLAEACLFGPGGECHVRCREWGESVLLFRRGDELWCKSALPLEIDGRPVGGPAPVEAGSLVTGPGLSFRLEAV